MMEEEDTYNTKKHTNKITTATKTSRHCLGKEQFVNNHSDVMLSFRELKA